MGNLKLRVRRTGKRSGHNHTMQYTRAEENLNSYKPPGCLLSQFDFSLDVIDCQSAGLPCRLCLLFHLSRWLGDMFPQPAGLFGFSGDWVGGRDSAKGATGLEPARSTCGSVGPLGELVVGIGGSFTRKGEEGCIGGSGVGERARICSIC